jgi:collagenase-like PrtC family protease
MESPVLTFIPGDLVLGRVVKRLDKLQQGGVDRWKVGGRLE